MDIGEPLRELGVFDSKALPKALLEQADATK